MNTAFQLGLKTSDHFFEWFQKRPQIMSQFNNHMAGTQAVVQPWLDPSFYPFSERLVNGAEKADKSVFMVDVGGGGGHDLEELLHNHPDLPGQLILQDQPDIIDAISGLDPRICPMIHDFFKSQPVKRK